MPAWFRQINQVKGYDETEDAHIGYTLRIRGSKATVKYREAISASIAITREVPDHILRQPNNRGRILPSTLSRSPKKILDVTDADVWVMASKTEHFALQTRYSLVCSEQT
jgi:hypothetical protein